jgi:hypothetical protein
MVRHGTDEEQELPIDSLHSSATGGDDAPAEEATIMATKALEITAKPPSEHGTDEYEVMLSPDQLAELVRRGEWLSARSAAPITLEAIVSGPVPTLRLLS